MHSRNTFHSTFNFRCFFCAKGSLLFQEHQPNGYLSQEKKSRARICVASRLIDANEKHDENFWPTNCVYTRARQPFIAHLLWTLAFHPCPDFELALVISSHEMPFIIEPVANLIRSKNKKYSSDISAAWLILAQKLRTQTQRVFGDSMSLNNVSQLKFISCVSLLFGLATLSRRVTH